MEKLTSPSEFEELKEKISRKKRTQEKVITICNGTACQASGARSVTDALDEEIKDRGMDEEVELKETGCHGFCEQGPIVNILPQEICYTNVRPEDVPDIITGIENEEVVDRLLYVDPSSGESVESEEEIPFYKGQDRIVFAQNREIDPGDIEDYISKDGYSALVKVLTDMGPEEAMKEIKDANLRGRGGGGFPAGIKWESTRGAGGEPKYVVVNCDEGDPGAYMDRSLMEGNPHRVLEGLLIGAYVIGSPKGFFYIREEYPIALENVKKR